MRSLSWPPTDGMGVHLAMGGVALLLALLLLVTPILENGKPSLGGTFLSRGELEMDAFPNGTVMLYVLSSGDVRFTSISMGLNLSVSANSGLAPGSIQWTTWHNCTGRVTEVVSFVSHENVTQLAVNVTTVYVDPGTTSPEYISSGVYAFLISIPAGTLTAYPLSPSLPSNSPQTWAFSDLPQTVALAERTVTVTTY